MAWDRDTQSNGVLTDKYKGGCMQGHLCEIRLTDQQPGTPERRLRDVVGACEKCPPFCWERSPGIEHTGCAGFETDWRGDEG